jgi:dolichyl-diphosphooligosaccharide--protein glycosyltransferase
VLVGGSFGFAFIVLVLVSGKLSLLPRVLSVIDPSYASNYAPIIASVSEHQPTSWVTFFFDLQYLMMLSPIGLFYLLKQKSIQGIFICVWLLSTLYFSSLMVRLVLVLAPAMCIVSAVGVSEILFNVSDFFSNDASIEIFFLKLFITNKQETNKNEQEQTKKKETEPETPVQTNHTNETPAKSISFEGLCIILLIIFCMLLKYMTHGTVLASEIYSSPTVIMSQRNYKDGSKKVVDDFRQAYYFLRQNTPQDARILAWWDYGYQIAGFSERITIADNNTWNFTHISLVGKALSSEEKEASDMMTKLDCEYVMVLFGGAVAYSGDDMNKMPWIVKITGSEYPDIKESEYFLNTHDYIKDKLTDRLKNSLIYKLSYYRFWDLKTSQGNGYDLVRRSNIGYTHYNLTHFEEVFTSDRWLIRIYKKKKSHLRNEVVYDNPFVTESLEKTSQDSKKKQIPEMYQEDVYV